MATERATEIDTRRQIQILGLMAATALGLPTTGSTISTWLADATASFLTGSVVQATGMLLTFCLGDRVT